MTNEDFGLEDNGGQQGGGATSSNRAATAADVKGGGGDASFSNSFSRAAFCLAAHVFPQGLYHSLNPLLWPLAPFPSPALCEFLL